jgi:hypothetical protein
MKKLNNNQLLKWFAKQDETIQLQVMENVLAERQTYFNNCRRDNVKPEKDPKKELGFFVSGMAKAYKEGNNRTLSVFDDLELVDQNRLAVALAKKGQRKAPKRKALLGDIRPIVEQLRKEGISWQGISDYVALHHKKKVSRGYLQKLFVVKF